MTMELSLWVLYCLSGALAGLCAGIFGVGGGTIIVPVLIFAFSVQDVPRELVVHAAVGTSLAAITAGLISSAYSHWKRAALSWTLFARLAPGMLVGVVGGSVLAAHVSGEVLRIAVSLLLFTIGLKMIFNWQPAQRTTLYGKSVMLSAGGVIGTVCAFTGVGGGGMTVPFLYSCGVRIHRAIATSAACGVVISCAGALSYIWAGQHTTIMESTRGFSFGFVNESAALSIAVLSMLFAPLGASIAHSANDRKLQIAFSWFLMIGAVLTALRWN